MYHTGYGCGRTREAGTTLPFRNPNGEEVALVVSQTIERLEEIVPRQLYFWLIVYFPRCELSFRYSLP